MTLESQSQRIRQNRRRPARKPKWLSIALPVLKSQNKKPTTQVHNSEPKDRNDCQSDAIFLCSKAPEMPILSPFDHATARFNMFNGNLFYPHASILIRDREQCATAVWNFNHSRNPTLGIDFQRRSDLFTKIVALSPILDPVAKTRLRLSGSLGPGVVVDTPFYCSYGYHLTIGSNVHIGSFCKIFDTSSVVIGNHVTISSNVTFNSTEHASPQDHPRTRGQVFGRRIIIENSVRIADNVTVLAGVCIGQGSTVTTGSTVDQDVPAFTVVTGNPARIVKSNATVDNDQDIN